MVAQWGLTDLAGHLSVARRKSRLRWVGQSPMGRSPLEPLEPQMMTSAVLVGQVQLRGFDVLSRPAGSSVAAGMS